MTTLYYFGCWDRSGHYLWNGPSSLSRHEKALPFQTKILDCGLLDPHKPQTQSHGVINVINGWTVLSFWDRTGDTRIGSNSAFIADCPMTFDEICQKAKETYPELWDRINQAAPITLA